MESYIGQPESPDDQVTSYLAREGLPPQPGVMHKPEEEDETMSGSASAISQPDGSDPGCEVLGFGPVKLDLQEPVSPGPNPEDINCGLPGLSPGSSSGMDSEPDRLTTPGCENESEEHECSISSTNEDPSLHDSNTAVDGEALQLIVAEEAPVVHNVGPEEPDPNRINQTSTSDGAAPDTSGASATEPSSSLAVPAVVERPPTPPGTWPCKAPGCNVAPFKAKWQLDSHQRVHSDERNYPCSVPGCKRRFRRKNECTRHEKTVHKIPGSIRFFCPYCPRTEHLFPRMDNLKRHIERTHSNNSEAFLHTLRLRGPGQFAG